MKILFAQDQSSGNIFFFKIKKLLTAIRCHYSSMHTLFVDTHMQKIPFSVSMQMNKLIPGVISNGHQSFCLFFNSSLQTFKEQ